MPEDKPNHIMNHAGLKLETPEAGQQTSYVDPLSVPAAAAEPAPDAIPGVPHPPPAAPVSQQPGFMMPPVPAQPAFMAPPPPPSSASFNTQQSFNAQGASGSLLSGSSRFHASAYLPEYLIGLLSLLGLLTFATLLIGNFIDSFSSSQSALGQAFDTESSVIYMAGTLAILPLYIIFTMRTRNTEHLLPEVRNHRWRRGFLGFFLVGVALGLIGGSGVFFYDIFTRLLLADTSLDNDKIAIWQMLVKHLLSIVLYTIALWVYIKDYAMRGDTNA